MYRTVPYRSTQQLLHINYLGHGMFDSTTHNLSKEPLSYKEKLSNSNGNLSSGLLQAKSKFGMRLSDWSASLNSKLIGHVTSPICTLREF